MMIKLLSAVLLVLAAACPATSFAADVPYVLVLSMSPEAECALSEKVAYGENKPIKAAGGQIGHVFEGKEYGPRACLMSLNASEWKSRFKYCRLSGFGQPEYSKLMHKENEQGGEFICRFTSTPDGAYAFELFGRRGAFCEYACD